MLLLCQYESGKADDNILWYPQRFHDYSFVYNAAQDASIGTSYLT